MPYEFEYEGEFSEKEAKEIVSGVKLNKKPMQVNEKELWEAGETKTLIAFYRTHKTSDKETFKRVAEYCLGSGNVGLLIDLSLFKDIMDCEDEEFYTYKRDAEKQIVLTSELQNLKPKQLSRYCVEHKIADMFKFRAIVSKVISSGNESALLDLPHAMNFKDCDASNKELVHLKRLIENAILTKSKKSNSNVGESVELMPSNQNQNTLGA